MADTNGMDGKVCVVTGANSGIGLATCIGLAKQGAKVVMVCRDRARGESALAELRRQSGNDDATLVVADLGALKNVRKLAEELNGTHDRIDVLVNNAALAPTSRTVTEDGHEAQFAVNHLAPFMLTLLLLDTLKAAGASRVVNVSSTLHQNATMDFDDLHGEKKYGWMKIYGQSKLANVLFTYELARRLEGTDVSVNCLHPGVVRTNLLRDFGFPMNVLSKIAGAFMLSPEGGAKTSVYLASSPEAEGVTGKYFVKCKEARSSAESHDEAVAKRLWDLSAELTGTNI